MLTPSGYVAIEAIQAGDTVRAFDEITGKRTWSRVTQTFVRQTDQIYAIHVPGDVIETTWSHPFYVLRTRPGAGAASARVGDWVEAKNLRAGDLLMNASGDIVSIQRVSMQMRAETVYNFEVEGQHTYFVSRGEVLVHNADYAVSDDFKIAQMMMLDTLLESVSPGAETISEHILGAIEEVLDGKGALGGSARILRTFVTAYNIPGDAEAIAAFLVTMAGTGVLQRVLLADVFDNEMANIKEAHERPAIVEGIYSNGTNRFLEAARDLVLQTHQRWAATRSRRMDELTPEGRNEFLRTRGIFIRPEELRVEIQDRVFRNEAEQIQYLLNQPSNGN